MEGEDIIARERIAALDRLLLTEIKRLEERLESAQRAVALLGAASDLAQDKFEVSVAARFLSANEFRSSLTDLSALMATRRELEAFVTISNTRHETAMKDLGDLRSRIDVGPPVLTELQRLADRESGGREQHQLNTTNLYLFVGAAVAVAGIVGHYL